MTDNPLGNVIEYVITITAAGHRGRIKLHTFAFVPRVAQWWPQLAPTQKQAAATRGPLGWMGRPPGRVYHPLSRRSTGTFHLADGVDPQAAALVVILDALRSAGRREVDLYDIKVVVSQLGSRISKLRGLPQDARARAEPVLFNEIVRRCTTLAGSD